MNTHTEISFKSKSISARYQLQENSLCIELSIKGWLRQRNYRLSFNLDAIAKRRQLKSALMLSLDSCRYENLEGTLIHNIENKSWKMFGFNRTHKFSEKPEFPPLAFKSENRLLGMNQSTSRPRTQITDAYLGDREGECFLLLRVGQYVSVGIGNGSGSTPDTAVLPIRLIENVLKEI